jgi:glyoxylate reductase
MEKPLVLIDVPLPRVIAELLAPICETTPWEEAADPPGGPRSRIAALFTYGHPRVDGTFLDLFPRLKVVSNFGVGVDHIDLAAAAKRRIPVGNTPGAVDGATADLTMAILLAAARNVVTGDRFARSSAFTHFDPSLFLGSDVHESTLGIIGMGRVGRQVARRARGFDMRVLYHNRRRDLEAEAQLGAEHVSLADLLARSDFVTLNVPLTPETRNLIGESELARMRRGAILVNVARGGVVDHDALYRALKAGVIRGAAIDVTEPEPLPRDHPLLQLDNVVITPHLGSAAERTRARMAQMAVENLKAGLDGRDLPWRVRS